MKWPKCLLVVIFLIFLVGCTDIKEIENVNYATAIGIDYKDGKYHAFVQMLDFGKVAKQETSSPEPPKIYVFKGEGKTVSDAFFKAYRTAQNRIFWAHVTAIVLTESTIEKGFEDVFDILTRYHEFRMTPWIYGTKESPSDIFSTPGFFNNPYSGTLLHNPEDIFKQDSQIRPVKLFEFAKEYFEPYYTTQLPVLKINTKNWNENGKETKKLEIDGAFYTNNGDYKGFYGMKEIAGDRWINDTQRVLLDLSDGNYGDTIVVKKPSRRFELINSKTGAELKLTVTAEATIENLSRNQNKEVKALQSEAEKNIKKEIESYYELGKKENIDFLNLGHTLYRNYHNKWVQLTYNGKTYLVVDLLQLKEISVNIKIKNSGSLKDQKLDIKDIM